MMNLLEKLLLAGLLMGVVMTTAYRPSPARADLNDLFSIFEPTNEQTIGEQQHPRILAQYGGEYIKPGLNDYVLDVGLRLAAASKMRHLSWRFTILNSPVVNAFALPGGYVYVTRGLLALANNEAELAGVLAHEIGHVNAKHGAGRQSRATGLNLLGALAQILTDSKLAGQLSNALGGLYLASYTREQEYQSDRLGVRYLKRAGYPPIAMADFLRRMQANADATARQAGKGGRGGSQFDFFASHPQTGDRIARAEQEARKAQLTEQRSYGAKAYLGSINGMLYGDDPEQGVIRGQQFLHPALRFKFDAPDEFQLINSSNAVYAVNKQLGQMTFDLDMNGLQGLEPYQYLRDRWLRKLSLTSLHKTEVNGAMAAIGRSTLKQNGRRSYLTAIVINFGYDRVARFIFLSPQNSWDIKDRFRTSFRSFRPMEYHEANELKPYLIKIRSVKKKDTMVKWIRRMRGIEGAEEKFALLNNLEIGELPEVGRQVKILTFPKE